MPYSRKRSTKPKRTVRSSSRTGRRRRKSSGHPWLMLFFIAGLLFVSAYVTDRMTNSAGPKNLNDVAAVHQLFADREEQGLVPSEDTGTPESVKEKLKAAVGKIVPKTEKAEKEAPPAKKEKKSGDDSFGVSSLISGITGKEESSSSRAAPAAPAGRESAGTNHGAAKAAPARAPAPAPAHTAPSAAVTGTLAVVIDDAGRDLESQHVYEQLGIPLTLAVMPNQVHTREAASSWAAHGMPVIVHQPMESVSGTGMEQKAILTSMTDWEISKMLSDSLSQVPEAVGINNHQGSKATADRRVMNEVMNVLHRKGMFFFDSRTNQVTAADGAAASYGVPYARNNLFVDNSSDIADIKAMIREAANRAKTHGTYIIIGHCRPNTAAAFREMVPKLQAEGIRFVYVSSLMK